MVTLDLTMASLMKFLGPLEQYLRSRSRKFANTDARWRSFGCIVGDTAHMLWYPYCVCRSNSMLLLFREMPRS